MEIVIARQPIYDKSLKVFAYELLYRSSAESKEYTAVDGEAATASVVAGTFLNHGVENVTDGKIGFINFTADFLKSDIIKTLPKEYLAIEILETVEVNEDILLACENLKELGYTIVLDDYELTPETQSLIDYADIIKMDFMNTSDNMLKAIVNKYDRKGIKFLAEKIETEEDFKKAKAYGYEYFQGYYFSKPTILQNRLVTPLQANAIKVIEIMRDEHCKVSDIAEVISYDPAMTYNLFKLANSAAFSARKVRAINTAIARIGLQELRTWVLFILMHDMNIKKPNELIRQSTARARVAEIICVKKKLGGKISDYSLMGLLSLLDVIMDTSFDEICSSMANIPEHIKNALIDPGNDNYGCIIKMIRAYDDARWEEAEEAGENIDVTLGEYGEIYLDALKWCDNRYHDVGVEF
jgi:EAL and modified HD-GYP domain-containing signal transduction protein